MLLPLPLPLTAAAALLLVDDEALQRIPVSLFVLTAFIDDGGGVGPG